jgi:hypothetical protein
MRLASILLLAPALAPLTGCCSFARFFCGPDRTKWVSVDYSSPKATTRTFLEALRRDSPEEVYHCLSQGFLNSHELDHATAIVAWDRVREQAPGLHVAGYAEVPAASLSPDGNRAHVGLDIEGRHLDVDLVCERKWEVRYRRPDGTEGRDGPPAPLRSAAEVLRVEPDADEQRSTVRLAPMAVRHQGLDELPASAIEFAGFVSEWKIDALSMPGAEPVR